MGNVSLITKIGLIVTTVGTLTIGVRYSSQYGDISASIEELKNRGLAYMQMYNTNAKDLEELQGIYEGILAKLGLEKGADLETITNKIDSITNEEQLEEIATALGLEPTAGVATIANKIEELNTKVSNLQTEIANAKTDLTQANSEQERITALLDNALEAVPAMATQEPGGTEEPGEEVGPTLEELKAIMNSAWSEFEVIAENDNFYKTAEVKKGSYTLYEAEGRINVAGQNKVVDEEFITALKAWEQAKTSYLSAGGEL